MTRRFERKERSFQRRAPKISGDVLLIVCEGKKTEPYYFMGLRAEWKISQAQIEIVGEECGSAPISVVDYAIELKKRRIKESRKGPAPKYDQVWCVFDHEGIHKHESYERAIDKAKSNKIDIAFSVPSFEFWYLLHYIYTAHKFETCDEVIKELKKKNRLPHYKKNQCPLDALLPLLETALEHAQRLREANRKSGSKEPATDVDLLVRELRNIKPIR